MFARFVVALLVIIVSTSRVGAQTPATTTPEEARQNFDQLSKQWADLYVQLQKKIQEKNTSGKAKPALAEEVQQLTQQVEAMVNQIIAAGLDARRAGVTDDLKINKTLIAIAGFYVAGDAEGDGGDQYEKALPLIKELLDAGLGDQAKELWLWGGVSAFCLNEFDTAKKYFDQAQQADLLGKVPPGRGQNDPLNRVWDLGVKQSDSLQSTKRDWLNEQKIRAQEAEADNLPRVKFQTDHGDIVIELFENEAPQAVASFINLVKKGFYDGVVFHRVLPSFMAQGGDPTGSGSGGPGYSIRCECYGPDYRKHFRGSLSMAHAGRNTGGSQFFLTFVPTSYLNGKHTVFGRVLEGMPAASKLKRRNPDPRIPGPKPAPDRIIKAEVLRDRGHAYEFEKLPER